MTRSFIRKLIEECLYFAKEQGFTPTTFKDESIRGNKVYLCNRDVVILVFDDGEFSFQALHETYPDRIAIGSIVERTEDTDLRRCLEVLRIRIRAYNISFQAKVFYTALFDHLEKVFLPFDPIAHQLANDRDQ